MSLFHRNPVELKINGITDDSSASGSHFRIQMLLTIVGLTGIAAIFLPFTWNESLINAVNDRNLWRLALPAFLPLIIAGLSLRWLFSKKLSSSEQAIAYIVSLASGCVTLSFYLISDYGWPTDFKEWLTYVIPLITLGLGIFTLLSRRRNLTKKPFLAIKSMQIAYLANILLCLTGFFGEWQIGAYFSLITVGAYLSQMILANKRY